MDVAVLGPLVLGDGGPSAARLGSPKERAVVEALALDAPQVVSVDALLEAVWGDRPPPSAPKTLQIMVSRVRRAVPAITVERAGEGYRLASEPPDRIDAAVFEHRAVRGRLALEDGDSHLAVELLSSARRLWRGDPAPDLVGGRAAVTRGRLEELFRSLVEDLNEARLATGGDAALLADLAAATAAEPLRERRWGQLMVALHRDGRQAEALRTFRRARGLLGEQVGLEPGAELRALERAIATNSPSLIDRDATRSPQFGRSAREQLPPAVTTFVGRDEERRALATRIHEAPLVTITGTGGVGKTRLAVVVARDVAAQFPDAVTFVDLTSTHDAHSMTSAVAEALGVRETPGTGVLAAICECRARRRGLLVLDNCEHVAADAVSLVNRLVAVGATSPILATSREPLGVAGEIVLRLNPLTMAAITESDPLLIAGAPAVRLFVDRATTADPGFAISARNLDVVTSLCRRLDGLPLAIELAAAQVDVLDPAEIHRRLSDRFRLLQRNERAGPRRHRTLRALLDWSDALLDRDARTVFHRLSVFRGSVSLAAIEAVVADGEIAATDVRGLLERLVRCSLVVADPRAKERHYRLLETIREYAAQQLDHDGEVDRCRDRHLDWALARAKQAAAGLHSQEQATSLDELDEHFDNLEAALDWSVRDPRRAARALGPVVALSNFWLARGTRRAQGVRWCTAIAAAAVTVETRTRVRALAGATVLVGQGDLGAATRIAATARRLADADRGDERAALYATLASCWCELAGAGEPSYLPLLAPSAQAPDHEHRSWIDAIVSGCLASLGDTAGASHYIRRAIASVRHDEHIRANFFVSAVDCEATTTDHPEVLRAEARASLDVAASFDCPSCEAQALVSLILVDPCDDLGGAAAAARRSLRLAHGIHETIGVLRALDMLTGALAAAGDHVPAVRLAAGTDAVREHTGYAQHEPGRRAYRAAGLEQARAILTPEAFQAHWAAGAQLGYDELVDEALATLTIAPSALA